MIGALMVAGLLSVAAQAPVARVLVLDFEAEPSAQADARALQRLVVAALARHPELQVLSSADVRSLVALEAERQAGGCTTESCLAEIADALGADTIVFGQLGALGATHVFTLNVYAARRATAIGRETLKSSSVEELGAQVEAAADRAVSSLVKRHFLASTGFWAGSATAVLAGGAGAGLAAWALDLDGTLGNPAATPAAKQTALDVGPAVLGAGVACVALAVGGVAWAAIEVLAADGP